MSIARKQLESYLRTLNIKVDRVLDVGGVTFPIKTRVMTWDVKDYKILDIQKSGRKAITDHICDLNEEVKEDIKESDIIFCLETMQFIWNPVMAFQNLNKLIKLGGRLFITFQLVFPEMKGSDYLRYTELGVRTLLGKHGFMVHDFQPTLCGYLVEAICQTKI